MSHPRSRCAPGIARRRGSGPGRRAKEGLPKLVGKHKTAAVCDCFVLLARLPGQNIRRQTVLTVLSPHRKHGACRKVEASAKSRSLHREMGSSILSPLGVEGPENT